MHLGYHELRNMLVKFKEDRDKRKMGPPSSVPSGGPPASGPPRGGERDYRSSRDDYRERDRGYGDRHSRYE